EYPDVSVNDADEFRQGMAIRRAGGEYGATTGRPRRVGWPDLPILRRALRSATPNLALTKLDVLNYVERINICDYYIYQGPDYRYCGRTYRRGDRVDVAIMTAEFLQYCQPHYEYFPGWCKSLDDIDSFGGLPAELKKILDYVVEQTNIRPRIISVGAERNETIFV
ncbi:MAG TPA: adenylosuccinate synthetase, partial [Candidatus Methylomirabilis sp.]|nr:adenylosuccinate synthetase [Candidatus Methylomirabilis sp.]